MSCKARLSMDCARVKEPQRECRPFFGSTEADAPSFAQIVGGNDLGIKGPQQSENTGVYAVLRLDSFWEAMVSSPRPA